MITARGSVPCPECGAAIPYRLWDDAGNRDTPPSLEIEWAPEDVGCGCGWTDAQLDQMDTAAMTDAERQWNAIPHPPEE